MPRHNRRRADVPRPSGSAASQRTDDWRGEVFVVRSVPGANATKAYRCPGCDQVLTAGVPHVVVWPAHHPDADERRHWHAGCWAARDRRGPVPRRR